MKRVSDDSTKTLLKNLIKMQVSSSLSGENVETISGVNISVVKETLKNPEILQVLLQEEFGFKGIIDARIETEDILNKTWFDVSFVIPDFSNMFAWTRKAVEESINGRIVVLISPVKTTAQWFHAFVLDKAIELRFLKDPIRYLPNTNEVPVCIAIYALGNKNKYRSKLNPTAISKAKISFTETDVIIEQESIASTGKYLSAV